MAIAIPCRQLFIDGEWREPVKKNRIPVINPSTEQIIGDIPAATAEDVEIAVDAAGEPLLEIRAEIGHWHLGHIGQSIYVLLLPR